MPRETHYNFARISFSADFACKIASDRLCLSLSLGVYAMKKRKNYIRDICLPVLVVLLIGAGYIYVNSRMQSGFTKIEPQDGVLDMRNMQTDQIYDLRNTWDYYPGTLYYPEDFSDPEINLEKKDSNNLDVNLGTYRLVILGKPGTFLEIAHFSICYGSRIFVNGTEVRNIGYVSADPSEAIPQSRYITIPISFGEDGKVEIIYQYSNFFHKQGGYIQWTVISSPELMDTYQRGLALSSMFTGCGLLFLAFYYLLFAAWQRNRQFLSLALCCLIISLRNQYFFSEHLLPPGIDFSLQYRICILIVSLIPGVAVLLLASFFPESAKKSFMLPFLGVFAVLTALHFTVGTIQLVGLCHVCYYICIPFALFLAVRIMLDFCKNKQFKWYDIFALLAVAVLAVMLVWEGAASGNNSFVAHYGISQSGMLICILILSIITNIRLQDLAVKLDEERRSNQLLEQVNTMNKDFLQTVAHELKTPLTVISGYAQLLKLQMERNAMSEQAPDRLQTIRSEADRLGDMVTKLMDYTHGQEKAAQFSAVDVGDLLKSAEAILRPVLEKRGNAIVVNNSCRSKIYGNFELLLQVIINLVVNAGRHTENGTVTVKVVESERFAEFTVTDTGEGIPEEAVPYIFERGWSNDGGKGLGLALCRDSVWLHGGEIKLDYTGPQGSSFRFTIPKETET